MVPPAARIVNLIIDHLTEQGAMDVGLLYASPYTDFSPRGVEGLFEPDVVTQLFSDIGFGTGRGQFRNLNAAIRHPVLPRRHIDVANSPCT